MVFLYFALILHKHLYFIDADTFKSLEWGKTVDFGFLTFDFLVGFSSSQRWRLATKRSRKYPESNRSTLAILFDERISAYALELLLRGATGPIPSALSRPSSLLLDGTVTKTAKPPPEIQTSIRRWLKSVPLMVKAPTSPPLPLKDRVSVRPRVPFLDRGAIPVGVVHLGRSQLKSPRRRLWWAF
jgi:hypothetical protein